MARARSIKPGFFSNEDLIELPFEFRLLFAGLWTIADRAGRLEDRPKKIKLHVFPGDPVDIEAGLTALANYHFIQRYEVSGVRYIQIVAWSKHQSPHIKEAASTIPAPDEHQTSTSVAALTPSSLTPDSGLLTADSGSPEQDAPPAPAGKQPTPEAQMAIALRDLGVTVTSIDPVLIAWVKDGFTKQQAVDAVGIARIRKPHPEPIHPNYIDPILRQPARAPPAQVSAVSRLKWKPPPDEDDPGCTKPNSKLSSKH